MTTAARSVLAVLPAPAAAPRRTEVEDPEQPLARLLARGPEALADCELLAVLLGEPEPALARDLLERCGGLDGLAGAEPHLVLGAGGRGPARVRAAVELAARMARREVPEREPMSRPGAVARYIALRFLRNQEVMGGLLVDARHRLLAVREFFRGTLHRVSVEPREVLKAALLHGAAGVVLFHTHPSGDPAPSREDLLFTRRMARAGEVVGVQLIDHLVVGRGDRWVSLRERGGW
jgi:DNA repair protein RadC